MKIFSTKRTVRNLEVSVRRYGVLTIYTNHPGENVVHKYKTIKFDVVVQRSATKYI